MVDPLPHNGAQVDNDVIFLVVIHVHVVLINERETQTAELILLGGK